ncbi:MAG: tetratricopeptide repeat protein [Acidobacteriaceae bacterium]
MRHLFSPQRSLGACIVLLPGLLVAGALHAQSSYGTSVRDSHPASSATSAYSKEVSQHYDYRFGKNMPFLPSNATTETGGFISPNSFPTAEYCGRCHQASYKQWRETAHANSFRNPWYIKNVNMLMTEKGIEYTRHCEGCHNPIALVSGALTKGSTINRGFDSDGVTCMTCHSIQRITTRGTGSYVMGRPAVMVDEQGKPIYGEVSDEEILAHLDRHSKAVMKDFYRTSKFCSTCHKAALPRELNNYKWQRAFFVYDEWQLSSFSKQSPLPFYVKPQVSTCETCHMPREPLTGKDPGAKQGMLASHRWVGANTLLAKYYNYDTQMQKTVAFLKNNALNIDLFGLERNGGKIIAPLGEVSFQIKPGDIVAVSVVIQNKGIGHTLVPEQRDFYESWVEFEAKDADGHALIHSGYLKPNGDLDPEAHSFTNRLINDKGQLNALHQVWDNRVVAYNNTIASGRSQIVRYEFKIPVNAVSPITITARVNYRRFNQHFIDFVMSKHHYPMPIVVMASRTRTLAFGNNSPIAPELDDNPVWMRWNNYGIAMLDAQQYSESDRAFNEVAALRPDYADAYTNIAIANFQWQRYDVSYRMLQEALQRSPHNARALYYLALVERNQGHVDEAIKDLREVTEQFPRSRDAHRELGFSLFQERKYAEARTEYETLQSIDPDDLAAHYILSIVYRRLGMKAKAAIEAAEFADQKDDPTASTYALEYLRNHPEIASESVPWHTHTDLSGNASGTAGPSDR